MNSAIEETASEINIEVNKKVNDADLTGANIMLRINNDESQAVIDADKISLEGTIIELTDCKMTEDILLQVIGKAIFNVSMDE